MANSEIRIGKVSSVDYEKGMMRVTYPDKDESVTVDFAVLNYNSEYYMPKVGQQVAVAHLSNGSSRGVVLGEVWNKRNIPPESGERIYRKDLSRKKDVAYIRYDDDTGEYLIKAANLHLNGVNKTVLDGPTVEIAANISILMQTEEIQAEVPEWVLTSGEADEIHGEIRNNVKIDQQENGLEVFILKVLLEIVENINIKAGTGIKVETAGNIGISAGEMLCLADGCYNTTLTEIMQRLEALEG